MMQSHHYAFDDNNSVGASLHNASGVGLAGGGSGYYAPTSNNRGGVTGMIHKEVSDIIMMMSGGSNGNGGGYFHTLTSVGQTIGRMLHIFFSDWYRLVTVFIPLSMLSCLIIIPSLMKYGLVHWLHPIVAVLFIIYILNIGRVSIIYATAEIYAGGYQQQSAVSFFISCLSKTKIHLFPLFVVTFGIGVFFCWGFQFVNYMSNDYFYWMLEASTHTMKFWLSLFLNILLFSVGIYCFVNLIILVPCLVIEQIESPFTAIQRSYELCTGQTWYIFFNYSIFMMSYFLFESFIELLRGNWFQHKVMKFMDYAPLLILIPMLAILETIMYMNVRIQKESYTQDLLQTELRSNAIIATGSTNNNTTHPASYNPMIPSISMTSSSTGHHHHQSPTMQHHHQQYRQDSQEFYGGDYSNHTTSGELAFEYRAPHVENV